MSSPLFLFNTLRHKKEVFQPLSPEMVTMYVCGPTVYNYAHIGNARPAVVFDVLARLLRHEYRNVKYARNFTDIDDKINAAAAAESVSIDAISSRYIRAYHEDMHQLGVEKPDLEPRVTEHVEDIIDLVSTLIEKGNAYEVEGHVLFNVHSYPRYGELSGRSTSDMIAGARVEVAPYKKNPEDFVLWKPSTGNQPGWSSPWGLGRPGWHVECSAMIERHLGPSIDIHGGGQDLIFPHHENEIAQGTCAHDGKLYCNTWVHNSFVTVNGQKMSKSLGNVLLVKDLLKQAPGEVIRLVLLMTHYRHPLDWNYTRLKMAGKVLSRLYKAVDELSDISITAADYKVDADFLASLKNDLNTPAALMVLQRIANEPANQDDVAARTDKKSRLLGSARLLGLLTNESPQRFAATPPVENTAVAQFNAEQIEELLERREQARQGKDFSLADSLRLQLEEMGVRIEDSDSGTRWHWRNAMH